MLNSFIIKNPYLNICSWISSLSLWYTLYTFLNMIALYMDQFDHSVYSIFGKYELWHVAINRDALCLYRPKGEDTTLCILFFVCHPTSEIRQFSFVLSLP